VHDQDIRGDLLEEITLDAHDGVYAFQHYGIFKGRRIKHWREEWRRHPDGSFTQTVIGPFENPRYTCTAPFQFNQWRCTTPGAPKPQRDRERTDYQTLEQRQAHRDGRRGVQRARLERVPPGGRGALSTLARVRGHTRPRPPVRWASVAVCAIF
jgi:hypothetical protein